MFHACGPHLANASPGLEDDQHKQIAATGLELLKIMYNVFISAYSLYTGATIQANTKHGQRFEVLLNGTFVIKNVQLQDRGQYLCTAQNKFGSDRMVVTLAVQTEPPKIEGPKYQHVSVYLGKPFSLDCVAVGKPQAQVSWILPDRTFIRDVAVHNGPVSLFPNGTLSIHSANFSSKGDYKCIASNAAGADTLTYQLHVGALPPTIKEEASEKNFLVDCVASGLPDPKVSWSLPDGTVINNALQADDSGTRNRRFVIFENGTLLLQQMGKNDEGDYTCYAKNTLGEDAMKVNVQVVPNSPRIASKDQTSLLAPLGQAAKMTCDATGEPPPMIIWISPTNEIITSSSVRYQILNDGTLIIKKVTMADQGKYACVARNSAGDDIKNVKLQVEVREPHIDGKSGHTERKVLAVFYQTLLLHCKADELGDAKIDKVTG
uniref:Ig-like domain-containing protein n=1 Tax=Astyanax mexicanus TaxID=7994 RepID=A0A8B9K9F7_ASTMX